jgi:alpha-tubulin suppressor-like RCC1 family protein
MSPRCSVPAYVWGYNNSGGLGLGHTARAYQPVATHLPEGTVDVQGGVDFTVALTRTGQLYSWGGNEFGQLGDGSTAARRTPALVAVPKHTKVVAIAAGTDHMLALTSKGQVLAWGRNHRGQVGNGATDHVSTPVLVRSVTVTALGTGDAVSAAVTASGDLLTWGRNGAAQLGTTATGGGDLVAPTKALLPHGAKAAAVDAGRRHMVVLTRAGDVLTFGVDPKGQPLQIQVPLKSAWGRVRHICAGDDFTLALTSRNVLLAWGANGSGQLGAGRANGETRPVPVALPHATGHVTAVQAGARSAVAVTSAHEVYSWGESQFGQAGLGQATRLATQVHPAPHKITTLTGVHVTGLHGGAHHTVLTASRGPAVGLRLNPSHVTARPGQAVTYDVRAVDAFGTDLGAAHDVVGHVSLRIGGGVAAANTVSAHTVGIHHVRATAGKLAGTATLTVKNGK